MASESSNIIALPIISIQHDSQAVISDIRNGIVPFEDIWLSCYKMGSQSVHGKVRVELGERRETTTGSRAIELVSRDGVHLEKSEKGDYLASCSALGISPTSLRAPRHILSDTGSDLKSSKISAVSVSPDLSQVAVGYSDGSICRHTLALLPRASADSVGAPSTSLTYKPHLSGTAISALSYFPSSRVLLSAGSDFAVHVIDADPSLTEPPNPIRSFKGHVRTVTGIAIVGSGRNVLSGARDGTLRLWDVAGGQQIRVFGAHKYSPINSLAFGDATHLPSVEEVAVETNAREVGTAGKVAFLALQSGDFECIDLGMKSSAHHSSSMQEYQQHGALTAIAYDSRSSLLATGSSIGVMTLFDTRSLKAPVCVFQRNSAGIEGLEFVPRSPRVDLENSGWDPDLAVATTDGLPFISSIRPNGPEVVAELVFGGDCEFLRALTIDSQGGIWLAGDEGVARMY